MSLSLCVVLLQLMPAATLQVSATRSLSDHIRARVRSESGTELEPAPEEAGARHGFQVHAIHTLHKSADSTIIHARHSVASRGKEADADAGKNHGAFATEREKIRAFHTLNILSYPEVGTYGEDVLEEIIDNKDSVFGETISSYEEEVEATQDYANVADAYIRQVGSDWAVEDGGMSSIDTSGRNSFGVHAIEWRRPGFGKVLSFRSTWSDGDYLNLGPWLEEWVLQRMDATLLRQWNDLAGLPPLNETDIDRNDAATRAALIAFGAATQPMFEQVMMSLASSVGLDEEKVRMTGYWEFTKVIVDAVHAELGDDEPLYLTGRSQGGGRASLSSMYLKQKHDVKYEAITFGSVGAACFSRELSMTGGNMLEDVNPYMSHEQITDYVHPLDIYGYLGHNVGRTCLYGTANIETSRAAKYCKEAFLHTGPQLFAAEFGLANTTEEHDLSVAFKQCRYFTHSWQGMERDLHDDGILNEDGSTDGGCDMSAVADQADSGAVCPASTAS